MPTNSLGPSLGTNFCQLHFSRKRHSLREKMPIWRHGTGKDAHWTGKDANWTGKDAHFFLKINKTKTPTSEKNTQKAVFLQMTGHLLDLISDNSKDQVVLHFFWCLSLMECLVLLLCVFWKWFSGAWLYAVTKPMEMQLATPFYLLHARPEKTATRERFFCYECCGFPTFSRRETESPRFSNFPLLSLP